ncbi:hypothetical protein RFI_03179 [Reticulomyxa filosa]|uniref:Uncharacterized protein n=1 Tax=Reticulomyxa filosa TaxID=46433 RepID=X6P8F5_RETFI|nr:hypothetical protein RFI_03179 [Reticulomyxa filosa]|eukprot:ETO33917.1 hypothetical protein RFI_03179 [Reticulomyxa filosa]
MMLFNSYRKRHVFITSCISSLGTTICTYLFRQAKEKKANTFRNLREKGDKWWLAISFGNTNMRVCACSRETVISIPCESDDNTIQSCVWLCQSGELLIGNHATDELVRTTTGKIEDIIFLIGKKLKAKILRGGDSILVVKENEDECRKAFESAITNVMIGVPDDFNNTAKIAGFKERIGIYVYNKMGWHYVVCGIIASIRPQLKHQLTFQRQAFVHIPSFTDGVDLKLAITREKFEEVLAPLFLKFSEFVKSAVQRCQVSNVILSG